MLFRSGGGLGALIGPTGGYIFGMLLSTIVAGTFSNLSRYRDNKLLFFIIGGLLATFSIYLIGIPWLKISSNLEWSVALKVGVLPFIVGDIVKLIVAISLSLKFYDRIQQLLNEDNN